MKNKTGIWIDHKHAVIINFNEKNETKIHHIESGFEEMDNDEGLVINRNAVQNETTFISNDKEFERRQKERLRNFYLEVILRMNENSDVYIFGPESAKDELAAKIRIYESLKISITKIEATERMTPNEVATKAKEYFHEEKLAA